MTRIPRSQRRRSASVAALALFAVAGIGLPSRCLASPRERTYSLTSWTEKDGIVGPISAITQDKEGYLWLGTFGGVVRFDGVRFTVWPLDAELSERPISALSASRDGSIWVGFERRDLVARIRGSRVDSYRLGDRPYAGFVRNLIEDRSGTIWAAAYGGLWIYRGTEWERIDEGHGLPTGTVDAVYEDLSGDLWVGSVAGIFRRPAGSDRFDPVPASPRTVTAPRWFSAGADGSIWIADPQGLIHVDRSGARAGQASGIRGPRRLLHDTDGNLWVGTLGYGLIQIPGTAGRPSFRESTHFTTRSGLAHDDVRSLFQDREGNIWVGTKSGLTRFTETPFPLTPEGQQLGDRVITAVTTTKDGRVWAASNDGLLAFEKKKKQWTRYGTSHGLLSDAVLALAADQSGGLWLTTDQGAGRFEAERFSPLPLPNNIRRVTCIAVDLEGGVWLSDLSMGVFRWKGGKLMPLEPITGRRPAQVIHADSRGRVWIGLLGAGVIMYADGQYLSLRASDLASGAVNAIHEDRNQTIWIATSGGVSAFKDGAVRIYRHPALKDASALISDDKGYLWLGVPTGVVRVHESELEKIAVEPSYRMNYRRYSRSDGLHGMPTRRSVWPSATRGPDGALWFVTNEGVTVIDPSAVDDKRHTPPPVRIENVIADDKALEPSPQLNLPPLTSRIQIDYTALTFAAPEKTRFRYKLEGFDTEWRDAGTRRQAFYTNLPPRPYRFRVSAYEDGGLTESSADWPFVLAPAFHQTRWFVGACLALAGLVVAATWRARIRGVHRRFALVMAERARMGRELHDTLLQGLVGALVQFDAVARQLDGTHEAAQARLERARKEVEGYIRETRQSILGLRSPASEEVDLPAALREIGENQTSGTVVRFEFAVVGEPRPCDPRLAEQFLRIGREAVHNAVRHAQATTIRLEVRYTRNRMHLLVTDDGRGFDPGHIERPGWGLITMRERAEQIGGAFTITSHPADGTTIEVMARLSRSHAA